MMEPEDRVERSDWDLRHVPDNALPVVANPGDGTTTPVVQRVMQAFSAVKWHILPLKSGGCALWVPGASGPEIFKLFDGEELVERLSQAFSHASTSALVLWRPGEVAQGGSNSVVILLSLGPGIEGPDGGDSAGCQTLAKLKFLLVAVLTCIEDKLTGKSTVTSSSSSSETLRIFSLPRLSSPMRMFPGMVNW